MKILQQQSTETLLEKAALVRQLRSIGTLLCTIAPLPVAVDDSPLFIGIRSPSPLRGLLPLYLPNSCERWP